MSSVHFFDTFKNYTIFPAAKREGEVWIYWRHRQLKFCNFIMKSNYIRWWLLNQYFIQKIKPWIKHTTTILCLNLNEWRTQKLFKYIKPIQSAWNGKFKNWYDKITNDDGTNLPAHLIRQLIWMSANYELFLNQNDDAEFVLCHSHIGYTIFFSKSI